MFWYDVAIPIYNVVAVSCFSQKTGDIGDVKTIRKHNKTSWGPPQSCFLLDSPQTRNYNYIHSTISVLDSIVADPHTQIRVSQYPLTILRYPNFHSFNSKHLPQAVL